MFFFFFTDPPPTHISTLSLHDALPIWLDDAGVERNAIVRLHRQKFHRRKVVIREFGHSVLVDRGDARAISAIKILALRRGGIRIGVVEGRSVGRKDRSMCSGLLSDGSKGCAVERYSIEVALKQRFFGCREIDQALCFIHAVERSDFPLAFGELRKLFSLEVKQIQMAIPAALARP